MNTVVTTRKGKIRGCAEDGCLVFKGIPYAKPPVGNLRWKAPQETESWDGIYEATRFSCKAVQGEQNVGFYGKEFYADPAYAAQTSEDCLYLNIWAPGKAEHTELPKKGTGTDAGLPVAFWIHGGAFMSGYGSEQEFDGAAYAKRGVILVTINYRLNVYGFLAHPWLSAESDNGVSGNYGILDQIAALKWVYDNIGAFGGDPDNITIFGQSAGAMSVQTLLSSELTGNMIAKAILQSGGSYGKGIHRDMPLQEAEEYGVRFAKLAGAKDLEELRAMSVQDLEKPFGQMMEEAFTSGKGLFLVPNIDHCLLKQGYNNTIEEKKLKHIPYLLGSTKNDIMVTKEELAAGGRGNLYEGCAAFSHKMEELWNEPSYVYYFTRQMPGDEEGAFHSSELWYMFGTVKRCWRPLTEADEELSERMLDYWTNFMKNGTPNGDGLPEWKPCSQAEPFVMEFNISSF